MRLDNLWNTLTVLKNCATFKVVLAGFAWLCILKLMTVVAIYSASKAATGGILI